MKQGFNIDTPEFTQADVVLVTGVSAKTLQNWTDPSRSILRLSQGNVGKGRRRLYSPLDMMALTLITQLGVLGISPNVVSRLFYDEESSVSEWFKLASRDLSREHICRVYFGENGLCAELVSSQEQNKKYVYEQENGPPRGYAFVQATLTSVAKFVLYGVAEMPFEQTPDGALSARDNIIIEIREELRAMRIKEQQA
ncbi:MAG: hypothetical protein ABJN98_00420 [Roseibium sp.]